MFDISILPLRQKLLLGLTLIAGLFIFACVLFDLFPEDSLNKMIFFFGIGVPLFLLVFDTLIDLNEPSIFQKWFVIAIVMFVISIVSYNSPMFSIFKVASKTGINSYLGSSSTSSLKALLVFLIVYWLLNKLLKDKKNVYIVNTFWQTSWYHDISQRKITGVDVIINLVLFVTIISASLFGF